LENAALGALFGRINGHQSEPEALELAGEALSFVGLGDRGTDDVASLNLHEQRFLELAKALAGRPRVLILDEVMAGLNESELEASVKMVRAIRDRHDVTVIWVEHVMKAVVSLAERVVVLNYGKVLTEGTARDVMRDPAVIEAYLGERGQHA
jgi:branched-chain amino acid transport system ATP-binding protein